MRRDASGTGPDRLAEVFERTLALHPDARAAFLDLACGDDAGLRMELDSLLASQLAAPDYLERIQEEVLAPALAALARDPLEIGRVIGRYELMEKLASGGMGDVFKARDRTLDRLVALKFLPEHRTTDLEARARLVTEARAASALDHPNIAVVYEIGTAEPAGGEGEHGRLFIAMGYYEGETLRDTIGRGPVPVETALDYAIQLADGLAAAHRAGIVHRDIKPANLIVTGTGQLKIVDFGIAVLAGAATQPLGQRVGTVGYMSPEQARGELVDHRADLWSAGAVLYEMLAGVRPFQGADEEAVVTAILEAEPQPLERFRSAIPRPVEQLVRRCLAKDPAARYAEAGALLADLRATRPGPAADTGTGETEDRSVLVLPFVNISRDPDNEYFSDGLTEEVIAELSHIRAIRVISRTSAMRLKGTDRDIPTIARELGVRFVLEGGVRKAGDSLRITVRFIEARGDDTLWARTFDGAVADVFEIQEQVARSIVEALRIRLSPAETRALAERPIPDPRAYESYLRARYEAWRFSRDGLARARRYIEDALAIVGENELLYGTLGHITAMHMESGIEPDTAALDRVETLAAKVFALNPGSPRGHWLTAFAAFQRADLAKALSAAERSLALAPDDPDTLLLLGYVYAHVGRTTEARELLDRAVELDPLTPLTRCMPGFVAVLEGRFADAVEPYHRLYTMDPESPFAAVTYGWVLAYNRRFDEAQAILDDAAARFPDTAFASWADAMSHALRGDAEATARAVTSTFRDAAQHSEMFARALAHCMALAGKTDEALYWVEREIDLGMLNHAFLAEHDWFLDGLRGDPRFERLLDRVRTMTKEDVS